MSDLRLITSESVTEGHPDKICDQISDAILDAILDQDRTSRVAVETVAASGLIYVVGEVTTRGYVDITELIRRKIVSLGYNSHLTGLDGYTCGVTVSLSSQSEDIRNGVDQALELREGKNPSLLLKQGAGDQGVVFGYATSETPELMPKPILLAHRLAQRLAEARKSGLIDYLYPDGKTQVTLGYEGERARCVEAVVLSAQHARGVSQSDIRADIIDRVIEPTLAFSELDYSRTRYLVNPAGPFETGGPSADSGLTGRKIVVDAYGGACRHGGGAFSGKDPSKVDRSGAYLARWIAKHIVAGGLADRAELELAYAIGCAEPIGLNLDTFGTHRADPKKITLAIKELFPLTPNGMCQALDLLKPIYSKSAAYGHFGRQEPEFTWEKLDHTRLEALRSLA